MAKFRFEYVYEYSPQRYNKEFEGDTEYDAYQKFNEHHNNDKSIIICNVKKVEE